MQHFANPGRFLRLTSAMFPWVAGLTVILITLGLYLGLFVAPADYQQGQTVRIMFVHVPAAWMALMVYALMALSGAVGLIWKHTVADLIAKSCAPIGASFTVIALITGALWGQPMWGTWWVWDARLTSVLILLFFYIGYIALWHTFEDSMKASKATAILSLIGVINLPIIKFSVDWWNTLHQPASVTRLDSPSIHISLLIPLLVMTAGFIFYFMTILIIRSRREIMQRRIQIMRLNTGVEL